MKNQDPAGPIHRKRGAFLATLLGLAIAGTLAAVAMGSSGTLTVGSAMNSMLSETVVVNGGGRTLYALSPETAHHPLCKSKACFEAWPPLTVHNKSVKLKDGTGVHGTLALIHRSGSTWQVTLRGKPLYRFSGDAAKGEANGQGVKSFGGTWHAAPAGTAPTSPSPPAPTNPSPPTYGY